MSGALIQDNQDLVGTKEEINVNNNFYNINIENNINLDFFNVKNLSITVYNQSFYNPEDLKDFFLED
jgi:hypothetical protein